MRTPVIHEVRVTSEVMLCISSHGIPLVQSKCQIGNNRCIMVVIGLISIYTLYDVSVSLLTWISSFFL